jgi:hypothetical protein
MLWPDRSANSTQSSDDHAKQQETPVPGCPNHLEGRGLVASLLVNIRNRQRILFGCKAP